MSLEMYKVQYNGRPFGSNKRLSKLVRRLLMAPGSFWLNLLAVLHAREPGGTNYGACNKIAYIRRRDHGYAWHDFKARKIKGGRKIFGRKRGPEYKDMLSDLDWKLS